MRGYMMIVLGIVVLLGCALSHKYLDVDGTTAAVVALFAGGGLIAGGADTVSDGK